VECNDKNGISILEDNIMEKILNTIKHFWKDHKVITGVVILVIVVATIL
tara:strand:- start:299 stop:445 length:147 start_codon:yes stop_codon:yes gene_type:complete